MSPVSVLVSKLDPLRQMSTGLMAQLAARHWGDYSRIFLMKGYPAWVLSWEMCELARLAGQIGIAVADPRWQPYCRNQAVFYADHFSLLRGAEIFKNGHRVGLAYFHGRPGSGIPEFDKAYEALRKFHHRINRIQVTHREMQDIVLDSGIDPAKVFLIPIGINLTYFKKQTPELRRHVRLKYGIPESAVVIGSFQKDGVGWAEGMDPKLVKGPDVLIEILRRLKTEIPELFVLLSGPARGYVKKGLERLGIPYRHHFVKKYPGIGELYQALDAYIVPSRQEGGPKAVLEAMASRIPIISTRVGQAAEIIRHGVNGWLAEVEDIEALVHWTKYSLAHRMGIAKILDEGVRTVQFHSYSSQISLWRIFMDGFVEVSR